MIREIVTVKDFHRISSENEHYLWNFVTKSQCQDAVTIKPFLLEECKDKTHETTYCP